MAFGGEIWFIDLKAGMEAENYCNVLARKAYTLEEAYDLLTDFNSNVDTLAAEWRGKTRSLTDAQTCHRLLVIDEAADMVRSGPNKKLVHRVGAIDSLTIPRSKLHGRGSYPEPAGKHQLAISELVAHYRGTSIEL